MEQREIETLRLEGRGTDHIWTMLDGPEPHTIGIRLDCGDSGVVYVTPSQAKDLIEQLKSYV